MINIDLNHITDKGKISYFSGKKKGLAVREALNLDQLDESDETINIMIPVSFDGNESFLGGLFSNSISHCGSRADFLNKYVFTGLSDVLSTRLNDVITATLSEGTALSGLKK